MENHFSKLSLPGGTSENGETAQCTAFRETWEETGLTVVVQQQMEVFDNGFYIYRCKPADNSGPIDPYDVYEVKAAHWINAGTMNKWDWRFPDQVPPLQKLLQIDTARESEKLFDKSPVNKTLN